jgi:hypothetical protein
VHTLNLTSRVTHLLVEVSDPPTTAHLTTKYEFVAAKRRGVRVLKPAWLEAVHQSWMAGKTINLQALEQEYTLPVFAGLSVCLTGFEDSKLLVLIGLPLDLQQTQRNSDPSWSATSLNMAVIIKENLPMMLPISSQNRQRVGNTNMLSCGMFESLVFSGSATASNVAWCWKKACTIQLGLSRNR